MHQDENTLPSNWIWAKLNQVGEIFSGGTPSTKMPEYWGDEVKWITPADLSGYDKKYIGTGRKSITIEGLKNSSAKAMPKGTVLFSSRAPIGYVAIAANELTTNQGFKSIFPSEAVFNEYLFYYLKFAKRLAEEFASGTTFKELSGKNFSKLPIPVPPLQEQHRIVSKIEELFSELDNGVANLQKAQAQLKTYRQAVLKWAFEGKLTEESRKSEVGNGKGAEALLEDIREERARRYREELAEWEEAVRAWKRDAPSSPGFGGRRKPAKPKKPKEFPALTAGELAGLVDLPVGWVYEKTGNVLDPINNGYTPKANFLSQDHGEVPFIKVYNLNFDGTLNYQKDPTFIPKHIHEKDLARSITFPGDVLINIVGPPLGKVSIVPDKYPEWNINQAIVLFRPNSLIESKFISYYMQNPITIAWLENTSKATAGQFNIKVSTCREIPFPVCPQAEQHQIVQEIESRLSVCDKLEENITEALQKAEALRQSILQRAFAGKLVPQDPEDEPAGELLKRIRALGEEGKQLKIKL